MNEQAYLLSIDQGTTSSRAIVFDTAGRIVSMAQQEFPQIYPKNGWVEHDPHLIWSSTLSVTKEAMQKAESMGGKVAAIGITNQRETTIIWDRETGEPVHNAIVWQDRRTADLCQTLKAQGTEIEVSSRSGLLLDPYFSSTKVAWILDHVEGARKKAQEGRLAFGTVDSFLIWRLTGGQIHATDITNASRTNLYNIHTQDWDQELLNLFNVPAEILPQVKECADQYGDTDKDLLGRSIPILGVAGDQQAATIGQGCFNTGDIKSTYGTGCFVLINTGSQVINSQNRLLSTVAYRIRGETRYALEGSIFVAGAAVQWLRDGLGIIKSAAQTESLAAGLSDNHGIYLVPAFTGLGAPHWDPDARGAIFGLTRDSGPAELVRATLESVCYQTRDLLDAMKHDGCETRRIRVDGGMVQNNWLMQFLADILNIEVDRPSVLETTALGVAYLAGLQLGLYDNVDAIAKQWERERMFKPLMNDDTRQGLLSGWQKAVRKVLSV
jgi:glycerol kinase